MDRIAALNEILTQDPNDTFARYGLAMEYSKQGDFDRALAEFSILLRSQSRLHSRIFHGRANAGSGDRATKPRRC